MSTIDHEPEYLGEAIPPDAAGHTDSAKRRAARTFHRGFLHRDPTVTPDDLRGALDILTREERLRLRALHKEDGHQLGLDPGPRQHVTGEPRNPWKTRRTP